MHILGLESEIFIIIIIIIICLLIVVLKHTHKWVLEFQPIARDIGLIGYIYINT